MKYVVEVRFLLDKDSVEKTTIIQNIVGRHCDGSGCGPEYRDVVFYYHTFKSAKSIMNKLLDKLNSYRRFKTFIVTLYKEE